MPVADLRFAIPDSTYRTAQIFEHIPWLGGWMRHFPQLATATKQFRAMCMEYGMRRFQAGTKLKDLFYYLVWRQPFGAQLSPLTKSQNNEGGEEKEAPNKANVLSDSALAIVAGSDTTASVFINIVYCLLKHPDVYKRLQAEVDEFYPPEENSLDPKHHTKMPYLEAVM